MVDRSRGHGNPRFELGPVKCYNALDRRAVELMLCYGLSPRTEQLQSVIVTQKPAVLCDTLVTHSQQGWCRSRGKSLRSTDQLLNGRLTSATAESNTVLSKRAPADVLLAVLEAHPSVPRCVSARGPERQKRYVLAEQRLLPWLHRTKEWYILAKDTGEIIGDPAAHQ